MLDLKDVCNIFVEFSVVENSNIEALKKEWDMLIDRGMKIHLWSKTESPLDMEKWSADRGIWDYIWDYVPKDSFNYGKVDFIIDPDPKLVEKFKSRGIPGNTVDKIG